MPARRYSPNYVNRFAQTIILENQDARSLGIRGIVLYYDGLLQPGNNIPHMNPISRQLFVPVKRHAHFAACHECSHLLQSLARI
jgi:hypothetical protein